MIVNLETDIKLPHGYHVLLSLKRKAEPWALRSWPVEAWPEDFGHGDMKFIMEYIATVDDRTMWYVYKNVEHAWTDYWVKSTINDAYSARYGRYFAIDGWYEPSESSIRNGLASALIGNRRYLDKLRSNKWKKSNKEIHDELFVMSSSSER